MSITYVIVSKYLYFILSIIYFDYKFGKINYQLINNSIDFKIIIT